MLNEYHVIKKHSQIDFDDFETFLTFIQNLNGVGVNLLDQKQNSYNILFEGTSFLAQISYSNDEKIIRVEAAKNDFVTLEMIRFVVKNSADDLHVFLPTLNIRLPLKEKYVLCYGIITDELNAIRTTIKNTGFELLFVERNPYANNWYALDSNDGTIHFLNDNLIHYMEEAKELKDRQELSYRVAEDLEDFVRRADVDLIPDHFYQYYKRNFKIIDYSGFNLKNPGRKVFVKPYIFEIDDEREEFMKIAHNDSALLYMDKIRKGESLHDTIIRILRDELDIAHDYIGATVARTIEFDYDSQDKLTPRLLVHIYIEKADLTETQKKASKQGWISPKQIKDFK